MWRSKLASHRNYGWRDHHRCNEPLKCFGHAAAEPQVIYTRLLHSLSLYCFRPHRRKISPLMPRRRTIPRIATDWRVVDDLSCLDRNPFVSKDGTVSKHTSLRISWYDKPLYPYAQSQQYACDDDGGYTHLLPLVHLRFRGPVQEFHHIFRHLGCCSGCAIFVFDETIIEDASHCDTWRMLSASLSDSKIADRFTSAREIGIEVQSRSHRRTWRWILGISSQQGEDVIAASVPSLHHQAEIRWESSIVRRAGCLVVFVWCRDIVR